MFLMALAVGVTFLWYSILTRGLLYIENCKTANLDSNRLVVLSYKYRREISIILVIAKFVLNGYRGGGSYFYGIVY